MAIYDINGNVISSGGGGESFYDEVDVSVDLLSKPTGTISSSNPEGFQTNTTDYRLIDYFVFTDEWFSLVYNSSGNKYGFTLAFYDSSKNYLSKQIYTDAVSTLTSTSYNALVFGVPSGTAYIRIQYRVQNMTSLKYVGAYMRSFSDSSQVEWVQGYDFKMRDLFSVPNLDEKFNGKKVICLGDSITENNSHNGNKAWCEYLTDVFGMMVYNNGKSGTGLVKGYQANRPICNRIDLGVNDYPNVTPDMVLIMANGNDCTAGTFYDYSGNTTTVTNEHGGTTLPIGTSSDTSSTLSVYGAMKHLFDSLIAKYPTAKIGFITSTPRLQDLAQQWGADKAHFYGHGAFNDYVTAIKWVCDEYNIPMLDLYHSTIFRPWNSTNASTFYADSEIHPNTLGTIEGIVKPVIKWIWDNF